MKTKHRPYRVAVFIEPGKRGWRFRAYLRDYNPEWEGCNIVMVHAASGTEAKRTAIQHMKNRWGDDLNSKLVPSGVNVYRSK